MRIAVLTDEEINQRIAAMDLMTDEQIFLKAAEIISNDPFLVQGSYLHTYQDHPSRPGWLGDEVELEIPDGQFNCHCLEGSIHEAVGIYAADPFRPGWLTDIGAIGYHFDKTRAKAINRTLVQVLPLEQLATIGGVHTIYTALRESACVVYNYSDNVLAPQGKEGVQLAVQYLTDAAHLAAELAEEGS